ncbi:MAG: cupin domain-containing protein [Acidimicrobiales bacterium]
MAAARPSPIAIDDSIAALTFLADRTPTTTAEQSRDAFKLLSNYREGGIFVGHWAGNSEWERHTAGDEIVMVISGDTTIFYLTDRGEQSAHLSAGQLVVVPQNTWHRFETPGGVKLLSVTPQPTDHSAHQPS